MSWSSASFAFQGFEQALLREIVRRLAFERGAVLTDRVLDRRPIDLIRPFSSRREALRRCAFTKPSRFAICVSSACVTSSPLAGTGSAAPPVFSSASNLHVETSRQANHVAPVTSGQHHGSRQQRPPAA
jgi:hypothetical protein